MKILMLGWELPPHNSGGLGVACLNMAHALSKQGAKIDFILPYKSDFQDINYMKIYAASNLDPSYELGCDSYESPRILEKILPVGPNKELKSIREVQKEYCEYVNEFLKHHHPDVVHAHDWLTYEAGILAKKQYGLPLVAHVHATEFDRSGMHYGNQLIHEVEYEGLMLADRIIAVSENTKRIIHEKYKIPLSKIDVIYNSIDENYEKNNYSFNNDVYRFIESLKKNDYTVISTVGRFTVQKGLSHLMHSAAIALQKNPKLLFIFAGDGEERNDLIKMAADLGIANNVIFTGFIRGKKLQDIYSMSDIFVMSSISEPFGLTALEAAHHENALILTKQSGVSEILWSALTYDFWDEQKLADEIIAISSNPALKNALKENVKNEYHKISWEDIAKKCLENYNASIRKYKK